MSQDEHAARRQHYRGLKRRRPAQVVQPGPGQESVWDYPRPPIVQSVAQPVRVEFAGLTLASTLRAIETAGPPVYYLPPQDVQMRYLHKTSRTTFCEWKGLAHYWDVQVGDRLVHDAAWSYPHPEDGYQQIKDYLAFYPTKMDACFLGDQRATPQPGGYYGGWITPEIVGPFKGEPGTENW